MKKICWAILIIVLLVGGFFAFNSYIYNEKQADEPYIENDTELPPDVYEEEASPLATYFQNELFDRAVEKTGAIPIEGYDAQLLMGAYPGLVANDFEGVLAFEGEYHVEGDEVVFTRTQAQPVSSAERTISASGYETLLGNILARLNTSIGSESDIDALITAELE